MAAGSVNISGMSLSDLGAEVNNEATVNIDYQKGFFYTNTSNTIVKKYDFNGNLLKTVDYADLSVGYVTGVNDDKVHIHSNGTLKTYDLDKNLLSTVPITAYYSSGNWFAIRNGIIKYALKRSSSENEYRESDMNGTLLKSLAFSSSASYIKLIENYFYVPIIYDSNVIMYAYMPKSDGSGLNQYHIGGVSVLKFAALNFKEIV